MFRNPLEEQGGEGVVCTACTLRLSQKKNALSVHYVLHHPCILGNPQREGNKIRIGGAHKWAIMLHHQGGQNQNWMPKPCLLGGPQVGRNPAFSGVPNKEDKVKTKKSKKKLSHGVPGPAYGPAD